MNPATIEIIVESTDEKEVSKVLSIFPKAQISRPKQAREPVSVTILVVVAASLEIVNGLLELRQRIKEGSAPKARARSTSGTGLDVSELEESTARKLLTEDE